MSNQVFVVASMEAQEGKFEELKQVVLTLAKATREEAGNVGYTIIEDPSKPNTIFSIEKWESKEAEAKHWETPHLKEATSKVPGLVAREPIMHIDKGSEAS